MTANLTAAFVEAGNRTIAVNSDFRRPTLSRRMSVAFPEPIGLDLPELEHAPLELVLAPSENDDLSLLDLSPLADASPGDLARTTARLIPRLAAVSDVVVVDTSPIAATAEVLELVPLADTIVMVIRLGHTSIQSARRSIEMVRTLSDAHVILAVVGGDDTQTGYYYYYSSKPPQEPLGTGWIGRRREAGKKAASVPPAEWGEPSTDAPSESADRHSDEAEPSPAMRREHSAAAEPLETHDEPVTWPGPGLLRRPHRPEPR
jgi:hypothetical protein